MKSRTETQTEDPSNGYEELSPIFSEVRTGIGAGTVREWAQSLPYRGTILDLGCGSGIPISQTLMELGFEVYGIDASPGMAAAFSRRFPQARVACEAVENSEFFNRQFDAVVSWGLFFLLPAEAQLALIPKIANALLPGGRFLFTSPSQIATWNDNLTGRPSRSLGRDAYKAALEAAGFQLIGEYDDEGENHYFDAEKQ